MYDAGVDAALSTLRHRVANDFNLLHALLGLAKRRAGPTESAVLDAMQTRARVMAVVHSLAVPDDSCGAVVDASLLLRRVLDVVRLPSAPSVALSCDPTCLEFECSVALALIVRELLDNALKHGFPQPQADSRVYVELRQTARKRVVLALGDNGVGFDPRMPRGDGLGQTIVRLLVEQLRGHLSIDSAPGVGTNVTLRFCAERLEPWPGS